MFEIIRMGSWSQRRHSSNCHGPSIGRLIRRRTTAALVRLFYFGDSIKSDLVAGAVKVSPAVGGNVWLWLKSHDIDWWVAAATITYIGLQVSYLVKKGEEGTARWLTYRRRHSRRLWGLLRQPFFFPWSRSLGARDRRAAGPDRDRHCVLRRHQGHPRRAALHARRVSHAPRATADRARRACAEVHAGVEGAHVPARGRGELPL